MGDRKHLPQTQSDTLAPHSSAQPESGLDSRLPAPAPPNLPFHPTSSLPTPHLLYPYPHPLTPNPPLLPNYPLTPNYPIFPTPAPSYYPNVCPSHHSQLAHHPSNTPPARWAPQLSHRTPIPPTISLSRYISPHLLARPPGPSQPLPPFPHPIVSPHPRQPVLLPIVPAPELPSHSPAFLTQPPAPLNP